MKITQDLIAPSPARPRLRTALAALSLLSSTSVFGLTFSFENTTKAPVYVAVSYVADQEEGTPEAGLPPQFVAGSRRVVDGFYLVPANSTAPLFTYKKNLYKLWMSVVMTSPKGPWTPVGRETVTLSSNDLQCSGSLCWTNKFPGSEGEVLVQPVIQQILAVKDKSLTFGKIFDVISDRSTKVQWLPAPTTPPTQPPPTQPPPPTTPPTQPPTPSGLQFCNKTTSTLSSAVGMYDSTQSSWVAKGWYVIAPEECKMILNALPQGLIYGFATAQASGGGAPTTWIPNSSGRGSFCVDPTNVFTLKYNDCTSTPKPNRQLQTFGAIDTAAGGLVTWNITNASTAAIPGLPALPGVHSTFDALDETETLVLPIGN